MSTPSANDTESVAVVIPVYQAEKILPALCKRLDATLSAITSNYEIILIDDRSPDGSWSELKRLAQEYPKIIAVRLSRNFGQHYAITAGLDLVQADWTVVMDCDLQERPEDIPKLLDKARTGYDIVLARRIGRKHKLWKRITSKAYATTFRWLSGHHMDDNFGSFRVLHRKVVQAFCSMRERYRLFTGMIEWLGFSTAYVDSVHAERYEGPSSYNLRSLFRVAFDGIISFSNRPLYISVALGLVMSTLASAYAMFLVLEYFRGSNTVAGWRSTITATTLIGGLILLNQGIIGIYIGRSYNQAKGRPIYVVDQIVAHSKSFLESEKRPEAHGGNLHITNDT